MAGFSSGEANFLIAVSGKYVWLRFSIAQDYRDLLLLNEIANFLNCGYITKYKNREVCEYVVTKIDDIIKIISPLFDKFRIEGCKYNDYLKFKGAAFLIKNKEHLDKEGLIKILELKNSMNKNN